MTAMDIKQILIPTDFSDCAQNVFPAVRQLFEQFPATFHFVHIDALGQDESFAEAHPFPLKNKLFKALHEEGIESPEERVVCHVEVVADMDMSTSRAIAGYAESNDIDLILMGTRGRGAVAHFFLGSVAEEVVREAPCPVLTVRAKAEEMWQEVPKRLLVPLDLSKPSRRALKLGVAIGEIFGAEVLLLHVLVDELNERFMPEDLLFKEPHDASRAEIIKRQCKLWLAELAPKVPVDVHIQEGDPGKEIVSWAEEKDVDLIVMPTKGLSGIAGLFLGSVAQAVVRKAPCPVLTFTPDSERIA